MYCAYYVIRFTVQSADMQFTIFLLHFMVLQCKISDMHFELFTLKHTLCIVALVWWDLYNVFYVIHLGNLVLVTGNLLCPCYTVLQSRIVYLHLHTAMLYILLLQCKMADKQFVLCRWGYTVLKYLVIRKNIQFSFLYRKETFSSIAVIWRPNASHTGGFVSDTQSH
jgi:hypothetical protein